MIFISKACSFQILHKSQSSHTSISIHPLITDLNSLLFFKLIPKIVSPLFKSIFMLFFYLAAWQWQFCLFNRLIFYSYTIMHRKFFHNHTINFPLLTFTKLKSFSCSFFSGTWFIFLPPASAFRWQNRFTRTLRVTMKLNGKIVCSK